MARANAEPVKENFPKRLVLVFVAALVGYVLFYSWIEHRRTRNGPWQVVFSTNAARNPVIAITEPALRITNLQVAFVGVTATNTNLPRTLTFEQPRPVPYDVPFGKCVFVDSTFLPGTLTFDMFGHEIELLPRVLVLDRQEHEWKSDEVVNLESK